MAKRLLVSFSGGETSAYMTHWVLGHWRERYDTIAVVFANTGREREETLQFIRDCDERLGFQTVWVEGVFNPIKGQGTRHRVVDFETASRNGEPFEAYIAKFGIPNMAFRGCSSTLKREVIESYAREGLGWKLRSFDLAIGIRCDEIDRISGQQQKRRIIYPLLKDHPTTKGQINAWWERQNWRLQLRGYEGNCMTCWKKTDRKLWTIYADHPEFFEWDRRMEETYGLVGPEFNKDPPPEEGYRRTFWRKNRSTVELIADFKAAKAAGRFVRAADDKDIMELPFGMLPKHFDPELDTSGGCDETCEVFGADDE